MLDEELRRKLLPLRNDLARAADPDYDKKVPVHRLAKELNRSTQWVIRHSGGDRDEMNAHYRLSAEEEATVREAFRTETEPPPPIEESDPLVMTVAALAEELVLPKTDVVNEAIRRGLPPKKTRGTTLLSASEVDVLMDYFDDRWRWRKDHPLPYVPRPEGHIPFEVYERIDPDELAALETKGFLPSRTQLARHPDRRWPHVRRHAQDLQRQPQQSLTTPGSSTTTDIGSGPPPLAATPRPPMAPQRHVSATAAATADQLGPLKKVSPEPKAMALVPPKPESVLKLQTLMAASMVKREVEGGHYTGSDGSSSCFNAFSTQTSVGSAAVDALRQTLADFSPNQYVDLFDQLRAVLALDKRVAKEVGRHRGYSATNEDHARILDEVCQYKFGIFVYHDLGIRLGEQARRRPDLTLRKARSSLMRLRPMYMGLMTHMSRGRFIAWRVGEVWDLLEVRFEDMLDWLDGLANGEYIPLTTHRIDLESFDDLSSREKDTLKFMAEASENLRQGIHGVRSRKASIAAFGDNAADGPGLWTRSAAGRALGYRAAGTWLVPITITNGAVDTTLDEDFFSREDGKAPHQVRSFYRRPKGSAPNAPRTEFVQGHVRGGQGRGIYSDPKLLPSVTIKRH